MKASILSAAGLLATGAMADAHVQWFGAPGCTTSSLFNTLDVALDGNCHNFGPFLPNSVKLNSCDAVSDCSCTVFEANGCTGTSFGVTLRNFQPTNCPDLTQQFEFFSVRCSVGLPI